MVVKQLLPGISSIPDMPMRREEEDNVMITTNSSRLDIYPTVVRYARAFYSSISCLGCRDVFNNKSL